MKVVIKNKNITDKELSVFDGDGYNFFFYDDPINVKERKFFSTYEKIENDSLEKFKNDEILYFQGNDLNIKINNYIWFSRASGKNASYVLGADFKDLYYFKNSTEFNKFLNNQDIDFDIFKNDGQLKKINKSAVFSPHWGWTDLVISNSIINYYSEIFNDVALIIDKNVSNFMGLLFPNNKLYAFNHYTECENLLKDLYNKDCVFLIDGHQSSQAIALVLNTMKLIPATRTQELNSFLLTRSAVNKKDFFYDVENTKTNDFIKIFKFLDIVDPIFDERIIFYTLAFFNKSDVINYFNIIRNTDNEIKKPNYNLQENYIVVNYFSTMRDKYFSGKNIFDLTNKSVNILDMLQIIEGASEIHIYDSLYGMIIYLSYFKLDFCKGKKIYYHRYARKKIHKFFDLNLINSSKDWIILE
jgi:hypothetical protein